MSGGKEAVLGAVRTALGRDGSSSDGPAAIHSRLDQHPKGPIPIRGQDKGQDAIDRFIAEAKAASALVDCIDDVSDIPTFVTGFLAQHNLPSQLRACSDPLLASVDWSRAAPLTVEGGRAEPSDFASLSVAKAGVAETGTLVLVADDTNPGTLNSLPQHHIVVLQADQIVGHYEEIWPKVREGALPRAIVWVTGPSRTADIEQELLLGAHGPQMLQILIVGNRDLASR